MAQKLPLRFRILHFFSDNKGHTLEDLIKALEGEYGKEKQFNRGLLNTHLQSLKAVGMLEYEKIFMDQSGELVQLFKLTEYGYNTLKYLPNGWEPRAKFIV